MSDCKLNNGRQDESSKELITRNNNNNSKSHQQTTALKYVFGATVLTKWVKKISLQQTQNAQVRQWTLSPSCTNVYECRSSHSRAAYSFLEVKLKLFRWKSRATDGAVLSITVCILAFAAFKENFPFTSKLLKFRNRFGTINWKSYQVSFLYYIKLMCKSLAVMEEVSESSEN